MKQYSLLIAVVVLVLGAGAAFAFWAPEKKEVLPAPVTRDDLRQEQENAVSSPDMQEDVVEEADENEEQEDEAETVPVAEKDLPASINLAVPFTSQAPHANWDLPYAEACEEASVLMAVDFVNPSLVDLSSVNAQDQEIVSLVNFASNEMGFAIDTTMDETRRFAEERYPGLTFRLIQDPTIEQLKAELAAGNPIVTPAAGRQLGNPNFSGAGPLYHMLVLRGYTATSFITNDPGTRNGEGYTYTYGTIMNALGDWNDGDPARGAKVVMVVEA